MDDYEATHNIQRQRIKVNKLKSELDKEAAYLARLEELNMLLVSDLFKVFEIPSDKSGGTDFFKNLRLMTTDYASTYKIFDFHGHLRLSSDNPQYVLDVMYQNNYQFRGHLDREAMESFLKLKGGQS